MQKDRHHRSGLKPVLRKSGWFARGRVPVRDSQGRVARVPKEISLGKDTTRAQRQAECDRLNRYFEDLVLADKTRLTFAQAYENYVDAGNDHPRKAEELIEWLGDKQCVDIDDTVIATVRKAIFKPEAKPSTINRHLYSPVLAILNQAAKITKVRPTLTRPKGYNALVPLETPPDTWFKQLYPHLTLRQAALVGFLTAHGRRLGDGLKLRVCDYDKVHGTVNVGKTKTGEQLLIELVPMVNDLFKRVLKEHRNPQPHAPLLGWSYGSASWLRREISSACRNAGVKYYSPHKFGRHTFATRMLRAGYSLQYVKDAGGWARIGILSERYGHLAKREVTKGVHESVKHLEFGSRGERGEVIEADAAEVSQTPENTGEIDTSVK